jgi:mono/diheme cytochrome c family protein
MRTLKYWILSFFAMSLLSCGGGASSPKAQEASADLVSGKAVYQKHCQVCHQADGAGVPKMFPPLTKNDHLKDVSTTVDVILNGMAGEIKVNGETYNSIMAPYKNLSDKEIADVTNYIRKGLNNFDGAIVMPEQVAKAR